MKKLTAILLCGSMLATGFIAGRIMDNKDTEPHQIQYFVDRIEEDEWLVVEVYDETTDHVIMVDIKAEEGYRVQTDNNWTNTNYEEYLK